MGTIMRASRVHGERTPGRVAAQEASCLCACHEGEGSYEKNGMKGEIGFECCGWCGWTFGRSRRFARRWHR